MDHFEPFVIVRIKSASFLMVNKLFTASLSFEHSADACASLNSIIRHSSCFFAGLWSSS